MFKPVLTFPLLLSICFLQAHGQNSPTTTVKGKISGSAVSGPQNNLRFFPLNLLESAVHGSYERRIQDQVAVGVEVSQTMGSAKPVLYPDVEFEESYFGPLGQYYFKPNYEGLFFEGGLNFVRAKIGANAGLRGEKVSREQNYFMPHATANFRMRTPGGFSATVGGGLFAYLGGDELKIDENRKGYMDGAWVEKSTKVETPYNSSPKLRLRLDLGYTF